MPPIRSQSPANVTEQEGRILLAIQALKKQEFSSLREVARCFNIPRSTLQNRLRGLQTARFLAPARINRQRVKKNLFKNVFSLWIYVGLPPAFYCSRNGESSSRTTWNHPGYFGR